LIKSKKLSTHASIMSLMASHVLVLLSLPLIFLGTPATGIPDMLDHGRNITDGETLVSANGSFTLGFFSPGVTTRRYLGIWFSVRRPPCAGWQTGSGPSMTLPACWCSATPGVFSS
jgi:hypothetical protein